MDRAQRAMKLVERALKRFDAGQGAVARKRARRRFAAAIRSLRAVVEGDFPLVTSAAETSSESVTRKRLTVQEKVRRYNERLKRLRARDYESVPAVGFETIRLMESGARSIKLGDLRYWPKWAILAARANVPAATMRKWRRDRAARKAFLAQYALTRHAGTL